MKRSDWLVRIVLVLFFGLCLTSQLSSAEMSQEQIIKEFGKTDGEPIHSGFIFFDGRYIDAPYVVSRRGLEVFINDVMVGKWRQWPLPDIIVKEDPGLPRGLTKDSTFDDLDDKNNPYNGYRARKYRYLHQHFPPEIAIKKIADYYASLPFVRRVTFEDSVTIIVETVRGEKRGIDIGPPTPGSLSSGQVTKEEILKRLEETRGNFERRLKKGSCIFLVSKGGGVSFGKMRACENLPLAIEILRSSRPDSEKISLLQKLSVIPKGCEEGDFCKIVTNFKASHQLEDRINTLVEETGITPKKYEDLSK